MIASLRIFLAATLLCLAPAYLQAATAIGAAVPTPAAPAADKAASDAKPSVEEQTQAFLANQQRSRQALAELKRQLNEAPQQITEAQRDLARLQGSPPVPVRERYGKSELTQLEKLLEQRSNELAEMQKSLAEANSLIITAQTRPERAQAEIASNQTRNQQINNLLKGGRDGGKAINDEQRSLLVAEQAALSAQTELRREELAGNSLLQDLGNSRRDLLMERIRRLEQVTLELQSLINEMRRESSEQTVAEVSRKADRATPDSLVAKESTINLKMSNYLLRATDRLNELTQQNLRTRQQLDSLGQADQALEEQISVLKGSLLLAKILYQQKQALPHLSLDKNLADEIADIRLYQFELNQQRDKLGNPQAYVDELLAKQPPEQVTPELRATLTNLLSTRGELLDRLSRELNNLLSESINLQLNQKQLQETSTLLRNTLDEQMFWIPSNKPLDFSWLASTPHLLERQLAVLPWGAGLRELGEGLVNRPWLFLPLLLVIGGLLWKRRYLYARLNDIHQDIDHFKRDSQLHTPLALFLTVLLALPVSLFLMLCGFALQIDARGQNATLGAALMEMAQAWMVFYTLYRILAPGGIAELHFHWDRPQVAFLRGQFRRLGGVVMALVAIVTVAEHQPAALADDVIGVVVVLSCFALMTLILANVLLAKPMRERATPVRLLVGLAFTLLPIVLFAGVCFGYYYTALKLSDRLIDTLYLLIIFVLAEAAFVRGLAVAARRLAYQRVLAKRQTQSKEAPEGGEVTLEEPTLDIEQVNQQSLRLTRLALFSAFIVALYWVWADLLTVFTYLDNVTLYEYTSGSGETATQVPISVLDVLGSLIVVGITIALARNLPGLLEVLVLSKLRLAQGSAYATTTLLSYAISGIGIVAALSALGVSWDKLQWLVAALSVGLGFGLQEIFANFISGLIILFERPVRIGDVVTIGNLSGTVSKIRIRATTITDFDRKEIIVPNKTFITGQLVNWSLTDTVTRVIIKLGLAYETDHDLARKLMMQACTENARVLRDPEPLVYFLNIGASTFDFELRFHVRELGDRNPAIDEILTRIATTFREHQVDMAFNQVDVFVKNLEGVEAHLASAMNPPKPLQDKR
ncbi:mechanosensitive channel MscK [Pseudomonas sp. Q1-7]|uniref:mechanosensitive channel MscK n=1 Tax=Pseudomonas sp. Q1-7 TaxID=3020843 RepID=UPI0023004B2A|nr:mechanosensitive channel MscK [Pseudomonas sp. Q1-7]